MISSTVLGSVRWVGGLIVGMLKLAINSFVQLVPCFITETHFQLKAFVLKITVWDPPLPIHHSHEMQTADAESRLPTSVDITCGKIAVYWHR
jgi:hypothetical protein